MLYLSQPSRDCLMEHKVVLPVKQPPLWDYFPDIFINATAANESISQSDERERGDVKVLRWGLCAQHTVLESRDWQMKSFELQTWKEILHSEPFIFNSQFREKIKQSMYFYEASPNEPQPNGCQGSGQKGEGGERLRNTEQGIHIVKILMYKVHSVLLYYMQRFGL